MVLYWRRYGRAGGCRICKVKTTHKSVLDKTDTFQQAEIKAKPVQLKKQKECVNLIQQGSAVLDNWFLPVIRELKRLNFLMTDKLQSSIKHVP